MLGVVMLNVIMLGAVMLNVVMLDGVSGKYLRHGLVIIVAVGQNSPQNHQLSAETAGSLWLIGQAGLVLLAWQLKRG
jgi:hypothetical protein